jgi:hypothetical protein
MLILEQSILTSIKGFLLLKIKIFQKNLKKLAIGKPLDFSKTKTFFQEWLCQEPNLYRTNDAIKKTQEFKEKE